MKKLFVIFRLFKEFDIAIKISIVAFILLILSLPLTWIFQSYFEAKAFNEVTGKNVTTWQAMWIELRVQEGAEK